jgi:hypothetical protein
VKHQNGVHEQQNDVMKYQNSVHKQQKAPPQYLAATIKVRIVRLAILWEFLGKIVPFYFLLPLPHQCVKITTTDAQIPFDCLFAAFLSKCAVPTQRHII